MGSLSEWMQPYLIWFIAGIAMLLLELAAPGVIIFFFAMGAFLVGAICLLADISINAQLVIFLVSSILFLLALRKRLKAVFVGHQTAQQDLEQELKEFAGEKAVVTQEIKKNRRGRVEFRGAGWDAEADRDIPEGATVTIVGKKSIVLKVEADDE